MSCKTLFAFLILLSTATALLASVGVSVEDNFFTLASITIAKGTTVVWTWNGNNNHSVTSGSCCTSSGVFDSGIKGKGSIFQFTFNTVGTFLYFCQVHGAIMTGSVTVTCPTKSQLLKNPGFESGSVSWTSSPAGIINKTVTFPPHSGSWKAQLNGKGVSNTASLFQQISIPSNACTALLLAWIRVASTETTTTLVNDKLKVQILDSSGAVLKTLASYSNLNKSSGYVKKSFNILSFKGKTIRVRFLGTENSSKKTTFLIDDTAVNVTK